MKTKSETYVLMRRLGRVQRRWVLGRFVASGMWIAGGCALFLAAYVAFDRFAALSPAARVGVNTVWAGVAALAALVALIAAVQFRRRDAARHADRRLGDCRRAVLCACELAHQCEDGEHGGLAAYLAARSVREGNQCLQRLRARDCLPGYALWRATRWTALMLAVAALIILLQGRAGTVGLARVAMPNRDIPPYTRLAFDIQPTTPRVVYGGKAEIAVEITGAPVHDQVWLKTRTAKGTHRMSCFQETPRRYAQRLENVVQELEFCFVVGKARTTWQPIVLLRRPQIVLARAAITAPPYAGADARSFYVGDAPFSGLRHAAAELLITSNRPLAGGRLKIVPKDKTQPPRIIDGQTLPATPEAVRFTWEMLTDAELQVTVRDIQGTPNQAPLRVAQKVTQDQPPDIAITAPAPFVMATPDATLAFQAEVKDDFGVSRLDWVRSLDGYRERFHELVDDQSAGARDVEVDRRLDLAFSGFAPGQLLEMRLEATDNNPERPAFTMSTDRKSVV